MRIIENDASYIHILIQQRKYDFHSFIREYVDKIDTHIESCNECRKKIIGWTSHLPKLRARMTIQFPPPTNYGERLEQMKQLKRGQCLPCGCEVIDEVWTLEQTSSKFYKALAEVLEVAEEDAKMIQGGTRLLDLPLSTKSLRRLRDRFWLPDGSSCSEEIRDAEEGDTIRQLPETIGQFIQEILSLHSGISYIECTEHWCP